MTVSAQPTIFQYVGNGVTTVFAYNCQVLQPSDLNVYVNGVAVTSGITKGGIGSLTGGTVTFSVAPANGAQVILEREVVLERTTDYQQNGDFLSRVVNPDFNRIWMALQQLLTGFNRALKFPKADVAPITELPPAATRANNLLAFDASGNPITVAPSAQSATALQMLLATSVGSSLIGFIQAGIGMVLRTLQDKGREIYSVKDAGAIGNGVANDLAALQVAAAALTSGMELHFPPGRYKLAWSGAKPEKSTIALDLFQLSNVKIIGHGATIVITNHDVGLYGGLLFCRLRACKNVEISGFNVEMSFVGSNTSALNYPESGFLYGHNTNENAVSWPVPLVDRLENIAVTNNTFSIQSQFGAYATSPNPYMGDSNNGGKAYSIFLRGEQAESTYDGQNKGIIIQDNTWSDQHQAYGIWVWGFSNVDISGNKFHGYAVRTANYLNATLGGSVPAIRCHKFFTRNWNIHHNIIQGRIASLRTGAFDGASAFISFQQEATAYDPESTVTINNNLLVLGSNTGALTDIGIQLLCGGNFDILSNTFACSAAVLSVIGIQVGDNSSYASNVSQYVNIASGNTFARSFDKGKPIVYTSASSVAAAQRTLKSLTVNDNIFNGYYRNVLSRNALGATYEGPLYQLIDGNSVNGFDNTSAPPADATNIPFVVYVEQGTDAAIVKNQAIRSCYTGIQCTGPSIANATVLNNKVIAAVNKPITGLANLSPNSQPTVLSFASASNVVVQGSALKIYGVLGLALDATGLVKDKLSGTFAGGTLIVSAPTGFTWQLFQWEVGDSA